MKEKHGADGHNLQDLFMKEDRIRHLGGKSIVVPSVTDFSIDNSLSDQAHGIVCKSIW
jgi:hypothetical protein